MRDLTRRLSLAVLVSLLMSVTAAAQSLRPSLGPQLGFASDNFDLFVGGQVSYQVAPRFDLYPSVIIYFPNGPLNAWGLNFNVRYWPRLSMPNPGLYVGGGLGYTHISAFGVGDSRTGLNLLGGWEFHTPSLKPFVELRAILASDVNRIEFAGGLNFKM